MPGQRADARARVAELPIRPLYMYMPIPMVPAHSDAGDAFCPVFRFGSHGYFGCVPSIHPGPGSIHETAGPPGPLCVTADRIQDRFRATRAGRSRSASRRTPDRAIPRDPSPKNHSERMRIQGPVIHRIGPDN